MTAAAAADAAVRRLRAAVGTQGGVARRRVVGRAGGAGRSWWVARRAGVGLGRVRAAADRRADVAVAHPVGAAAGRATRWQGPQRARTPMGPQATKPRPSAKGGLGGEQVEGRQAVRELLLANRRDTREIWMAADLDPAPVLDDIRELAGEARVLVKEVGRGKLEAAARTDAPQRVIAFARPILRWHSTTCSGSAPDCRRRSCC
ncbi:MAG: RNA methyltransferase substrate-binding domain-containing protein [Acidimicrobiales bacterium]